MAARTMASVPPPRGDKRRRIERKLRRTKRPRPWGFVTRLARRESVTKQYIHNIDKELQAEIERERARRTVRRWRVGHRLSRDDIGALGVLLSEQGRR